MNTAKTHQKNDTTKNANVKFKDLPAVEKVNFVRSLIEFHLADKRIITIPIEWVAKLKKATKAQREKYTIRGHFVFWDDIDEIIGVKNLLNGSIVP